MLLLGFLNKETPMKALVCLVPCLALSGLAFAQGGKTTTLSVDTSKSKMEWAGTKKVGDGHNGEIAIKSGSVVMGEKTVASAELEIEMASMKSLDLKDPKDAGKLEGHLKSPDFFDIAKFPSAKLVVVSGKDLGGGKHELKGKMTIKDVTQDVTFPIEVKKEGAETVAMGKLVVDRTKYGVKYGSGNFFKLAADKVINDSFDLNFKVVAK
jgi:polyisoprenoid-binding protein YceI